MAELPDGIKKTREKKLEIANRCPYIGLAYDPYTVFSNPTQWNRCFHVKRASQVALGHQTSYCLTPGYLECEVYTRNLTNSLPKAIRLNQYGAIKRNIFLIILGVILSMLFLVGLRFWLGSLNGFLGSLEGGLSNRAPIFGFISKATSTSTVYPTQVKPTLSPTVTFIVFSPSLTPTLTPTASFTKTPTRTQTASPTFTPTITPTSSPTRKIFVPTLTFTATERPPSQPKPTRVPPTAVPPTSVPPTEVPTPLPTSAPPLPTDTP